MSNKGYAFIHRRILDNKAFKNDQEAMAFALLVIKATHQDYVTSFRGNEIKLKTGQLVISTRSFAKSFDWSQSKTVRFFQKLAEQRMVRLSNSHPKKPDQGITILTICNYRRFQKSSDEGDSAISKSGSATGSATGSLYNTHNNNTHINNNIYTREDLEAWFEKRRKSHVKAALPDGNLELPDSFRQIAVEQNHPDPNAEWENFTDHSRSNGRKYVCYKSAWRNWLRNSFKFGKAANNNYPRRKQSAGDAAVKGARMAMAETDSENTILF